MKVAVPCFTVRSSVILRKTLKQLHRVFFSIGTILGERFNNPGTPWQV